MPGKVKESKADGKSPKTLLSKSLKSNKKAKELETPEPVVSEDEETGSDDGHDEDGVDEEGMGRLMKALGDDGLDDIGQMQLKVIGGEEAQDEENESDDDSDDVSGSENGMEEEGDDDAVEQEQDGDVEEAGGSGSSDEEDVGDDVALEDVDSMDEDAVPRQKIEIDNKVALERIRDTIKLDSSLPWTETLTVTYPETIEVDVEDDLNRELAFYKQALHGADAARNLAAQNNLPFTRPPDYFAEMVKSDSHMERIRQRLLDENATIKRSEEKRREREGKKFGKQVQVEKLKERERSKKDMEEKLKGLKRKRKDGALDVPEADGDAFDVAVEDALTDRPAKRGRGRGNLSRTARDSKFGFGGKGKRDKQNTRESTEMFDSGSRGGRGRGGGRGGRGGGRGGSGGRGGTKRLGKGRRMSARSK